MVRVLKYMDTGYQDMVTCSQTWSQDHTTYVYIIQRHVNTHLDMLHVPIYGKCPQHHAQVSLYIQRGSIYTVVVSRYMLTWSQDMLTYAQYMITGSSRDMLTCSRDMLTSYKDMITDSHDMLRAPIGVVNVSRIMLN
jgi:hypothetical protein